jgi:hypothetical protein
VLAGAGDPGRESEQALTAVPDATSKTITYAGDTGFTLWTDTTAISLYSAGGNLTPTTSAANDSPGSITNDAETDYRYLYPSTLEAVAASGSLYYGTQSNQVNTYIAYSLELAPSPTGELSLLAQNSIYAHGYAIDMSGANNDFNSIPNPYNPAYTDDAGNPFGRGVVSNILNQSGNAPSPDALFAFEADTPTTDLHADDTQPNRVYAATGDLVDVQVGEVINFASDVNEATGTWYLAAKPTDIMAGEDIVGNGTQPQVYYSSGFSNGAFSTYPNERVAPDGSNAVASGDLLLNLNATDTSVVSAGRDILGSYFYIAGPGLLEVDAGRNITETGGDGLAFGVLKSIGTIIDVNPATRTGGAGIAVLTGTGSIGPDYSAFSGLYFNAANQADLSIPLSDPANDGKVQQTYQAQLLSWLQTNYAYTGTESGALGYFQTLPAVAQDIFVRSVFFQELQASGLQESDPTSLFYKSYARGRTAIATLFPSTDAAGTAIPYDGSLTMESGMLSVTQSDGNPGDTTFDAGISTLYGGSVQILSPGGQDVFGTEGGPAPGANSGVITYGSGDIDIYALESVELGESRIFTTFGGNILIWSAQGDINAGRGSKTTQVYQPPLIAYDDYGGITLSPAAVTSGAGIATLTPIAGTAPGDVDLIAPEGTVDAGEAGIRVSGDLNIAALRVVNAANVQVQGKTTGNTAVVATNTAAAVAAASTAGSSVSATTNSAASRAQQSGQVPSTITVEILGGGDNDDQDDKRRRPAA